MHQDYWNNTLPHHEGEIVNKNNSLTVGSYRSPVTFIFFVHTSHANFDFHKCSIFTECCF